jgi:hypothetical protein
MSLVVFSYGRVQIGIELAVRKMLSMGKKACWPDYLYFQRHDFIPLLDIELLRRCYFLLLPL